MRFKKTFGYKKRFAMIGVTAGAFTFIYVVFLLWTYGPLFIAFDDTLDEHAKHHLYVWLGAFVGIVAALGFLASFVGPVSVRRLYGGRVTESSPHLVGFEGTMPKSKLEKLVFGNDNNHLSVMTPPVTLHGLRIVWLI